MASQIAEINAQQVAEAQSLGWLESVLKIAINLTTEKDKKYAALIRIEAVHKKGDETVRLNKLLKKGAIDQWQYDHLIADLFGIDPKEVYLIKKMYDRKDESK